MRVFLAIDLPEHVKSRIFHKFEIISGKRLFRGKVVRKEDLHLTLKFFGNLTNRDISFIKSKLEDFKFEELDCEIGRVGFFDNEDNIKVIWFELKCEKLKMLYDKLCGELEIKGEEFNPHITIARVREVVNKQELLREIKSLKFRNLGFRVGEMVLMKSVLTSNGHSYKILNKYFLN